MDLPVVLEEAAGVIPPSCERGKLNRFWWTGLVVVIPSPAQGFSVVFFDAAGEGITRDHVDEELP